MLDHYSTQLFGAPKPMVISEYGGRAHTMEQDPWSPERDWVMLKSLNSLLMAFLERPDNVLVTIPFIVLKAEWGRTTVPYNWRLMRQQFEASGEAGNEWVYTELVRFYELWSDVNGTRVDSWADDQDILVDAYLDGADLYVIVNNLEFDNTTFDLDVGGIGSILSVDIKHLRANNDQPVLETTTLTEVPESIALGGEATMILRLELDAVPTVDESSDESKHYAATMLQPIAANTTLSFDVDGLTPGANGEAVLRLGVGRDHGLSLTPDVTVNGSLVTVPTDYRGYDQHHGGAGRVEFFGILEIPIQWSDIAANNRVEVTFPDDGGHVSSIALQVFNQSQAIVRGAR
jgi:agarase